MTIIQPILTPQTITFLGRYIQDDLTVVLIDKQNDNNVYSELLPTVYLDGLTTVLVTVPFLKDGNNYLLEVSGTDGLCYRGLAFCTSSTDLQNYSNN